MQDSGSTHYLESRLSEISEKLVHIGEAIFDIPLMIQSHAESTGNALERVQWVHEPADLWDITFCTH